MPDIRVFVAIKLSEEILARLGEAQQRLWRSPGGRTGRWVNPQNIHLTLKFLGDVATHQLGDIYQAVERGCQGIPPFPLRISGLGCFPSTQRPRIIWAGAQAGELLSKLQREIESQLAPLGIPPENRAFRPHLTLARIQRQATTKESRSLGETIASQPINAYGQQRVDRVAVIKSDLRPSGAVYIPLYEAMLYD